MNEHKLLDELMLHYLKKPKITEDTAYELALETILTSSIKAHQELDRRIMILKSRGEL